MSWSEIWPSSRDWRIFAALLLALPAGGCFQPLYGEAAHPGLTADMQAIAVEPIGDRIGHYLGDDLIANLNGTGSTPTPKYRLTVKSHNTREKTLYGPTPRELVYDAIRYISQQELRHVRPVPSLRQVPIRSGRNTD